MMAGGAWIEAAGRAVLRLRWLALPPACRACGDLLEPLAGPRPGFPYLCPACHAALPWRSESFAPLSGGPLDGMWAAWRYEDPVRRWIWALKYGRRDGWAVCLGALTARLGAAPAPGPTWDVIAPVPLHRRRLRERGFNQSLLLAHHWRAGRAAAGLPVPKLAAGALARTRHTRPQMELGASERQANVAGAFTLAGQGGVRGARVLLVDDVMTTGATLNECARALKAGGAASVDALVLAKA
jgi:ComF family protein